LAKGPCPLGVTRCWEDNLDTVKRLHDDVALDVRQDVGAIGGGLRMRRHSSPSCDRFSTTCSPRRAIRGTRRRVGSDEHRSNARAGKPNCLTLIGHSPLLAVVCKWWPAENGPWLLEQMVIVTGPWIHGSTSAVMAAHGLQSRKKDESLRFEGERQSLHRDRSQCLPAFFKPLDCLD
jgi:hypothetical protein